MLRILLDTNVYVSAILFNGKPRQILQAIVDEKVKAYISNGILEELEKTFSKPKFKLTHDFIQIVLSEIRNITQLVSYTQLSNYLELRDRDDYHILEAAFSAKVDYLITGDKDLLSLRKIKDFKIISPDEFIKIHEK
jgi:putative PIN family toxin of toxin-antitoxin system